MPIIPKLKSTRLYKAIFGYDVFISYSRKDSMDYAYAISQHLIKKNYVPYIDQLTSTKKSGSGDRHYKSEISDNVLTAIKNTKGFILIGSPGAQEAQEGDPVVQEIDLFQKNGNNKFLIPISIEDAISLVNVKSQSSQCTPIEKRLHGLPIIHENDEAFSKNKPGDDVLLRIENALNFTKKSRQLRNIAIGTLVSVIVVTGAILLISGRLIKEKAKEIEGLNGKIAKVDNDLADSKKTIAANLLLQKKLDSINKELVNSNKTEKQKADSLRNLYTKQYNSAKEMTGEFDKAVTAFPGYEKPDKLVLFTRLDHAGIEPGHQALLDTFIANWKKSRQNPITVKAHYMSYHVDDESLDIVKMSGSGTTAYNIQVSQRLARSFVQYLTAHGIPPGKVSSQGYGSTRPLSTGIIFNNRVEIE